jgi:TDG/mug DNA glycosylase family protein
MLPDLLVSSLKIIFCGTAVGDKSALKQAYYAGPGNKFYKILYKTRLTNELLNPQEYPSLLKYRLGLTDLVKSKSGMDHTLSKEHFDIKSFETKILKYKPSIVCFNGKKAAEEFIGRSVFYGLQSENVGNTILFVAPSTSGAANGHWDENYWFELKKMNDSLL